MGTRDDLTEGAEAQLAPLLPSDLSAGDPPPEVRERAREMQALLAKEVKATQSSYRAGLIAGLNEAALIAEKHREERFRARDEAKAAKSPKAARDYESMAIEAGHIEVSIRARIAALETEAQKK